MSSEFNCSQCQARLTDLVDGCIDAGDRSAVYAHLDHCAECNVLLSQLWNLQSMAARWRDEPVPRRARLQLSFEPPAWFGRLQVASALASVLLLVLVLTQVHVTTRDGFSVRFGDAQTRSEDIRGQLDRFRAEQQSVLSANIDQLNARQATDNQLVFSTLLAATRNERRQDIADLLSAVQDSQAQQARQTQASLRYLIESQLKDRRDIQQLDHAIRLVANEGGKSL